MLGGVAWRHYQNKTLHLAFDKFQKFCLVLGALIVVFWLATDDVVNAYKLTQALAIVAYTATVRRLWTATRTTEAVSFWCIMLLAGITSVYPAIIKDDELAYIYLGRAIPSTLIIIYLILRVKRRMGRQRLMPATQPTT